MHASIKTTKSVHHCGENMKESFSGVMYGTLLACWISSIKETERKYSVFKTVLNHGHYDDLKTEFWQTTSERDASVLGTSVKVVCEPILIRTNLIFQGLLY